jgi:hypothetical protein
LLLVAALAAALLALTPSGDALSETVRQVFVTNFPPVQEVAGEVRVKGPIRLSELVRFDDVLVAPVQRSETTRLIRAGTLETDGFPNLVLSLHGQVKGSVARMGSVGVILLPSQEGIQQAFDELGLMHFALEAVALGVSSETPYFASDQPRFTVGFQAYEVLLYNTTDKTVNVDLFAYLTQ